LARCFLCGREVSLPFTCSYCGSAFCESHRLPESHDCPGLGHLRKPEVKRGVPGRERRPIPLPRVAPRLEFRELAAAFSRENELRDLAIAWLTIAFCYSVGYLYSVSGFLQYFLMSLVTIGSGFLLHELAHRFTARKFGLWAKFRLWWSGLIVALATAVLSMGRFFFAAPGAVYILASPSRPWGPSRRENGLISLSGAVANVAVGVGFLALTPLGGLLAEMGRIGYQINLLLAVFNLLPVAPLDGQKVISWSVFVWAAAFIPLAGLLLFGALL